MAESGNIWMKGVKSLLLAALFIAAVVGSGWMGISLAKKNLPDWVGKKIMVLRGSEMVIGGEGQEIYLAEKNQSIKDFFNHYPSSEERLKADVDQAKVRRFTAEVNVRVKRRDAGTVSVEVLEGPLNGEVFWMPLEQLLQDRSGEELPLIKDDGGIGEPRITTNKHE